MRAALALISLLALAACGAAGAPTPPDAAPQPGMTISGTAEAGIARDGG